MQETTLACAPMHFVRVQGEPCINKVVYFIFTYIVHIDNIRLATYNMIYSYSQQLAILLNMLQIKGLCCVCMQTLWPCLLGI
jgi:hypothetical protein